jgi:hypothetical protein
LDRMLVINESAVYAELDDEAVLLNVDAGIYFGINAIGTEIWNALGRGDSESAIVDHLAEEYDVEPGQLRTDVAEFLSALESRGLIRVVEK